jgi:hypothetical protein
VCEVERLKAELTVAREREAKLRKHWGRKGIYQSDDGKFFLMDGTTKLYDTEDEAIDDVCGITNAQHTHGGGTNAPQGAREMETCWNCGSKNYIQSTYTEWCPDCGIACSYSGGGLNSEYEEAMKQKWAREEEEEQERRRKWERDNH